VKRLLLLAALVAGCGGHTAVTAPRPTPRLVVVGDSLAAGRFADAPDEAFPQRVAAAAHMRLELLGIPGATTAQLAARALPGGGDVAVVEAGTNDFLHHTPRRRFARDYRELLAKVAAASPGAKLVCLTVWIPRADRGARPYNATIRRTCGAVADISPLYTRAGMRGPQGRPTFLGPGDEFHPNSAGHAAIAQAIEARL
jgi:acyl-CoA thioesterase I